jgi:hypothetical protein
MSSAHRALAPCVATMDAVNVGGTPPAFFRNMMLAPTALPASTSVLLSPSISRRNSVTGCIRVVKITLPLNVGGEPPRFLKKLTLLGWKDTMKLGGGWGRVRTTTGTPQATMSQPQYRATRSGCDSARWVVGGRAESNYK